MKSGLQKTLTGFLAKFDEIIKEILGVNWKTSLLKCSKQYQIKCYKIQWLSPPKVREIYQGLVQRYYIDENTPQNCWHQNELRVFVWTLLTWSEAINIKPDYFTAKHWNKLSQIFNNKSVKLLEFQYQNLKKLRVRVEKWSQQEDQTLKSIIEKWKNLKISWNEVSKQIYYSTSQKIFRPPKQCRQRWNNYLDPGKTHGQWTLLEDRKLVDYVIKFGKRWAMIGKQLQDKRTQHMVKNRYNSLVSKFKKQNPSKKQMSQTNLIGQIHKYLYSKNEEDQEQQQLQQQQIQQKQEQEEEEQEQQVEFCQKNVPTEVLQQSIKDTKEQKFKQQQKTYTPMNFAHPVPLSLFQKTSQNDSNLFGSPRIGTTPGPAALFTLTPFLISPNPNGWSGQGGNQNGNYNIFSFDHINHHNS